MRKILSKLMGGVLLFGLSMSLTSCEGALDDILGEWSRPTPGSSTGGAVAVTGIDLDADEMKLAAGDKGQLTATVAPDNATDKTVTWSSDKEEIATVDENGLVTAVAMGTAIITAKAGDKTATCEVTVTPGLATPLTVEAITQGKIVVSVPQSGMKYSTDGGVTKKDISDNPTNIPVAAGDKVAFYGTNTSYYGTNIGGADDGGTFKCKVYGNIMSLLYEDFADRTELPAVHTFEELFKGNAKLTDASGLLLPATTLADYCYSYMFKGCTGLTTIPEKLLPATTLAHYCYSHMFEGCTGLTTAPELPATTLTIYCYCAMFYGCSNLIATPHLAAPTSALVGYCYQAMFHSCTSLKKAYVKAVYKNTYGIFECDQMFFGCTDASTSTFYSADAGNYKSAFGLNSWQTAAYE